MTRRKIMKTIRIAFVLASAFVLLSSCFLLPVEEEEYLAAKGLIDPILKPATAQALEQGSTDPQWFTLHAAAGTVYQLGFADGQGSSQAFVDPADLAMSLYASDKSALIAAKSGGYLVFSPPAAGDYCVRVTPATQSVLPSYTVYMLEFSATLLTDDAWANGSLASSGKAWYRFNGVEGVSYFIRWNDEYDGDGTKTAQLIVSAYGYGSSLPFFSGQSSGYDTAREIIPASSGPILLLVENNDWTTGTYAIKYFEPDPPQALTDGAYMDGDFSTGLASWYSFEVVAGDIYYINWNSSYYFTDPGYGDGTKTAMVQVDAYHDDRVTEYFTNDGNGAFTVPRMIIPTETGTVYLRVSKYSYYSTDQGTFAIKYRHAVPLALTDNVWSDGTIETGDILWYSFPATAGEPYYVNWNESGGTIYGDGTMTGNVNVSAFASDKVTSYFTGEDYAYSTPYEIVPSSSGTVYLKVTPSAAGTFGIRSRHGTTTALTDNVWSNGTVATGDVLWYSFPVTADEPYYVNWNESGGATYGNGTMTGNITVTAYASDRATPYFTNQNYAYSTPYEIVPSSSGTVYLKVTPSAAGTFGIRSRHGTTTALTENAWSNGTVSTGDVLWYSFSAGSGTVYEIAWNETGVAPYGDGTMTGNITVSVYASDKTTAYFTNAYYAYTNPLTLIAPSSGTVYLKVTVDSAGTFALRYRAAPAPTTLSDNAWMPGTISTGETLWYAFPVEGGERYYVNWNEAGSASHGDSTQSGNVTVSGYVNGTLTTSFTGADYAFTSNRVIDASVDGIAYLKVVASTPPGTFQIRYRQSATIPLTDNAYTPGVIVSGEEIWYSFPCAAGEAYNVFLNRAGSAAQGDGSQTAAVSMSAYYTNRSDTYFTSCVEAFTNPVKIYSTESGWIFLRIYNGTGTFAVRYQAIPRAALTQGTAFQDSLLTGEVKGYSFTATAGTSYVVRANDSYSSTGYTCDVYFHVSLGGTYLCTYRDSQLSFTAASSGTVNIYVGGYNSSPGTFAILYTAP
jgi:hypothetical protein